MGILLTLLAAGSPTVLGPELGYHLIGVSLNPAAKLAILATGITLWRLWHCQPHRHAKGV